MTWSLQVSQDTSNAELHRLQKWSSAGAAQRDLVAEVGSARPVLGDQPTSSRLHLVSSRAGRVTLPSLIWSA